jgi:hypothetical protein
LVANFVDGPVFAILIQHGTGRVICDLQAVRYPGGGFAAAPHQPPDLLATARVEASATGFTATCSHPGDDGWSTFTVTAPDSGAALHALLDLTAHAQIGAASRSPLYLVNYPAFDTAEDATLTRTISLSLVGHRRRVTHVGHVQETYLGFDGRRVAVYRYRRGNPTRATRIRFTDPGTDSLQLAAHALDHLARTQHARSRRVPQFLRRAGLA